MSGSSVPSLAQILADNKDYLVLLPTNKIRCHASGHEMPPRVDAVIAYINSKTFKKTIEWYSHDFSKYLPHIVQDKNDSRKLYCKVTGRTLNKIPDQVEKHVHGKKFLRLKGDLEQKEKSKKPSTSKKVAIKDDDKDEDDDIEFWVPPDSVLGESDGEGEGDDDENEEADDIDEYDEDEDSNDNDDDDSEVVKIKKDMIPTKMVSKKPSKDSKRTLNILVEVDDDDDSKIIKKPISKKRKDEMTDLKKVDIQRIESKNLPKKKKKT